MSLNANNIVFGLPILIVAHELCASLHARICVHDICYTYIHVCTYMGYCHYIPFNFLVTSHLIDKYKKLKQIRDIVIDLCNIFPGFFFCAIEFVNHMFACSSRYSVKYLYGKAEFVVHVGTT